MLKPTCPHYNWTVKPILDTITKSATRPLTKNQGREPRIIYVRDPSGDLLDSGLVDYANLHHQPGDDSE